MTRLICVLLTLFFLNGPAMGENSDFGRSSLAAKEVLAETGQIALREGDVYLAVIMDGKIIAKTGDVLLSHEVFVARTVGAHPKGAEVVSIGKSEGVVAAITSKTFSGTQTYASEAAQAAADTAFK